MGRSYLGKEIFRRLLANEFGTTLGRVVRTLHLLALGFRGEVITLRAAALTYITLLSLVPLLAVIYSVVEMVGGKDAMQGALHDFLAQNLAVGARAGFLTQVDTFVRNANASAVGGVGFFLLLLSALSLLWNMESAFNHIFGVKSSRSLLVRAAIYWCMLTLGPILLAVSLAITAQLAGPHGLGAQHSEWHHAALALSSAAATNFGFFVLYRLLPSAPVKNRSAFFAALTAGTIWEVAKVGYAHLAAHLVRFDTIYGSLSAIPIFLLWVYASWIVVLFGCRLAYAGHASRHQNSLLKGQEAREVFTGRVALALAEQFSSGGGAVSVARLATALKAPVATVAEALVALTREELVNENDGRYLLTRPPKLITLAQVRAATRASPDLPHYVVDGPGEAIRQAFAAADAATESNLGASLASVLDRT